MNLEEACKKIADSLHDTPEYLSILLNIKGWHGSYRPSTPEFREHCLEDIIFAVKDNIVIVPFNKIPICLGDEDWCAPYCSEVLRTGYKQDCFAHQIAPLIFRERLKRGV